MVGLEIFQARPCPSRPAFKEAPPASFKEVMAGRRRSLTHQRRCRGNWVDHVFQTRQLDGLEAQAEQSNQTVGGGRELSRARAAVMYRSRGAEARRSRPQPGNPKWLRDESGRYYRMSTGESRPWQLHLPVDLDWRIDLWDAFDAP